MIPKGMLTLCYMRAKLCTRGRLFGILACVLHARERTLFFLGSGKGGVKKKRSVCWADL